MGDFSVIAKAPFSIIVDTESFWPLYDACLALANRMAYDTETLHARAQAHPMCQRVQAIPGITLLTVTALVAAVPDVNHFKNGCQLALWFGLLPGEHSKRAPSVCWG